MFCPKCGSLMYPSNGKLKCKNCGHEKEKEGRTIKSKRKEKETVLVEDIPVSPTTKIECPECGNKKAYWILRQTRGADEPETRIYTCTKCGYRWREY